MVNRLIGSLTGYLLIFLLGSFSFLVNMLAVTIVSSILILRLILSLIWALLELIMSVVELIWKTISSKVAKTYKLISFDLWFFFMKKHVVLEYRNELIKDPKINVLVKLLSLCGDFFYSQRFSKSQNAVVLTPEETIELRKSLINKLHSDQKVLTKQYQDKIDSGLYAKHELLSITKQYDEDLKRRQRTIKWFNDEIIKLEKEG